MFNPFKRKKKAVPRIAASVLSYPSTANTPYIPSGWSGIIGDVVISSGWYDNRINDELFMADCWRRTKENKDNTKCESCHLRFECYTNGKIERSGPQGPVGEPGPFGPTGFTGP